MKSLARLLHARRKVKHLETPRERAIALRSGSLLITIHLNFPSIVRHTVRSGLALFQTFQYPCAPERGRSSGEFASSLFRIPFGCETRKCESKRAGKKKKKYVVFHPRNIASRKRGDEQTSDRSLIRIGFYYRDSLFVLLLVDIILHPRSLCSVSFSALSFAPMIRINWRWIGAAGGRLCSLLLAHCWRSFMFSPFVFRDRRGAFPPSYIFLYGRSRANRSRQPADAFFCVPAINTGATARS